MITKNKLLTIANHSMDEAPLGNPNFPPSPYYRFLKNLAKETRPRLSVELGVCGGGASFHLCIGYPLGRVIGIDYTNDYPDNIEYIKSCFPNYYFMLNDSVIVAKSVFEKFGQVDILFIDTIHTYARTMVEYNAWFPYLSNGAIVCFDDLHRREMHMNGINIWEYIKKQGKTLRLDFLHHSQEGDGGFGVLWSIQR